MMWIEIMDILAGNEIDFSVPFGIEGIECFKLLPLPFGKHWKVGLNTLHFRPAN